MKPIFHIPYVFCAYHITAIMKKISNENQKDSQVGIFAVRHPCLCGAI